MKPRWVICGVTALALVSGLGTARGQVRRAQIGFDGGVEHHFAHGSHETLVGFPPGLLSVLPSIRVGLPLGRRGQLETAFGASVILFDGEESWTEIRGGVSLLVYGAPPEQRVRPFLRFGLLSRVEGDEDDERGPQFGYGGGFGFETALGGTAALRFEGSYSRFLADVQEHRSEMNVLAGRIGLSVGL